MAFGDTWIHFFRDAATHVQVQFSLLELLGSIDRRLEPNVLQMLKTWQTQKLIQCSGT
jgi:hypothetical protein